MLAFVVYALLISLTVFAVALAGALIDAFVRLTTAADASSSGSSAVDFSSQDAVDNETQDAIANA
jgi:hypothetical protein